MTGPTQRATSHNQRVVIHGALDPILPLPNGRALADLIEGARLHVLPDTGHELNPRDLDELASLLTAFLADNTS